MANVNVNAETSRRGTAGLSATGVSLTNADVYFVSNDGNTLLYFENGATPRNVTISIPQSVDGQAVTAVALALGANVKRFWGPMPTSIYNRTDGRVQVAVDGTGVTMYAVKLA